jgi:hypothetical protein
VLLGAAWLWRDSIDLAAVGGRLASIDPLIAGLALLLYLGFSPLNAGRLKSVAFWAAGVRLPFLALLRVTCIGHFVAAAAPIGLLGDVAKVGLMRPLAGLTWRSSIQSVFCDRASGAVFCAGIGALLLPARLALGAPPAGLALEAGVFLLVLGGTALLLLVQPRLPASGAKFWQPVGWLLAALASLFDGARRIAEQAGFAGANILLTLGIVMLLARGMGIQAGALQIVQFVPVIILVTALPLLYLGWGGREMIMVSTLGALPGVAPSDALSLAIALGGLGILGAFPNGLALLTGWRSKPQT